MTEGTTWMFSPRVRIATLALLCLLVPLAAGGYFVATRVSRPATPEPVTLTIESDPDGAEVLIAGVKKGTTPVTLTVATGAHALEVVHDGRRKSFAIDGRAGATIVHHVEFAPRVADAPMPSVPEARSTPAATSGQVESRARRVTAGWLIIASEIPLQVIERTEVLGTTASPRIMLPAGRHSLRFVNTALGFSDQREVSIREGKVESIRIKVPRAPLSVNAVPWAEVWIDGRRVGETPLGNYMVGIGEREVVFRHPQLGERRKKVTIGLSSSARVSMDFSKQ